ncbi:MAG: hypothetical protein ACI867_002066 [Glaciecola sp.]
MVATPAATASASAQPSMEPTPTEPAAPRIGYVVSSSDPAALVVATVRAGMGRAELDPTTSLDRPILAVAGVLSPTDRDVLRSLDEVVVISSDVRTASRLGASAAPSVSAGATASEVVNDLSETLASIALEQIREGADDVRLRLAMTTDPAVVLAQLDQLQPGDLLLTVDDDPRAPGPGNAAATAALQAGAEVALLVDDPSIAWKLAVLEGGLQAPGGGQLLAGRRYLAAYGSPGTSALGVLGEQAVEATHQRILDIAAPYDDGTLKIVPVFEIIAAVASASATGDGDYSYGISFDLIREWVDYAAANDILVILDIQPGRTDFLTHAKQYEEFLVQPHVGMGLDPEWRLKPNQVHLRQIGTVDGAEVNQVIDYLAGLVRDHALPQKMLVLHQFRHSMITNREIVRAPDELFVVLHFDGQGGQPAKESGFHAYADDDAGRFAPGWKNFYDEDRPMAGADRVLALRPQPVFISFQ